MMRDSRIATTIVVGSMFFACAPAGAADIQLVKGKCISSSHVAEGRIGEDLTKRQSRFFCNVAVITFFDAENKHVMIQFSQKESYHDPILGFAGFMLDGQIMHVEHIYLQPGQATPSDDGVCKFFFKKKSMSGISCAAKIDESGRRTVPVVGFEASPGQ